MPTNKTILNRGISYVVWALPLFFFGPTVVYNAFQNTGHPFFIPVLGLGIIMCTLAIILVFKGLKTIMDSQTDS